MTATILTRIDDLADDLMSDFELFAEDTSVFHVFFDSDASNSVRSHDLRAVQNWAYPRTPLPISPGRGVLT